MKRTFLFLLLGTLMAVPSIAQAWLPPVTIDAGIDARFNVYVHDYQKPLAPWYTYWPMRAHFQTPAPVGGFYPNWPQQWPPAQAPAKAPAPKDDPGKLSEDEGPHVYRNQTSPYSNMANTHQSLRPYYYGQNPGYQTPAAGQQYQPPYYYQAPSYWYGQ